MKHFTAPEIAEILASNSECIEPFAYTAFQIRTEVNAMAALSRSATPDEIEAERADMIKAANILLSIYGVKQ